VFLPNLISFWVHMGRNCAEEDDDDDDDDDDITCEYENATIYYYDNIFISVYRSMLTVFLSDRGRLFDL
jgi:hypothetical protein